MSLPVGVPSIITISALALRMGVNRSTLWRWIASDPKWRGCIAKSSRKKLWLSVPRLIDNGLLPRPEAPRVQSMAALSFTYEPTARVS